MAEQVEKDHWTLCLPKAQETFNDGAASEGVHGPERQAWLPYLDSRWPITAVEVGYAVWGPYDWWRRLKSGRAAIEIVIAGDLRLMQEGREYLVKAGQAMILHRGTDHVYATGPSGKALKRYVTLSGTEIDSMLYTSGLDRIDVIDLRDLRRMSELCKSLYRLLKNKPEGYEMLVSTAAYAILAECIYSCGPRRSDLVQHAADYLLRNLNHAVSNADLAAMAGVTPGYLVRLFRAEFGRTPMEMHLTNRIALARRLLQTTAEPVKAIATRTGFSDPLYFSRVFARIVGVSPRQFRRTGTSGAMVKRQEL